MYKHVAGLAEASSVRYVILILQNVGVCRHTKIECDINIILLIMKSYKFYFLCFALAFLEGCSDEDTTVNPTNEEPVANECDVLVSDLSFAHNVNIQGLGAIVNDEANVFIYSYSSTSGGTIHAINKSNNQTKNLITSLGAVNGLALDGTHIYWLEYDVAGGGGKVNRILKDGTGIVEVLAEGFPLQPDGTQSDYNVFFPNGLALDDTLLYWGEEVGGGAIRKIAKSGGAVEDIDRGGGFKIMSMIADNNNIYVIDANENGQIIRFNKATGEKTVLITGMATSQAFSNLELYDNKLYWTEITNSGNAYALDLSDNSLNTIKSGLINPRSVCVNTLSIFVAAAIFQCLLLLRLIMDLSIWLIIRMELMASY
jgi:hypothetical protein